MPMFAPFAKYATFSGRARRLEYWMFQLFQILVYLVIIVLAFATIGNSLSNRDPSGAIGGIALFGLAIVFALACFLPNLAVTTRRLHDSGKSAWWLMLYAPGMLSSATNMQMIGALSSGDPNAIMAASTSSSILSLIAFGCNIVMFVFMVLPGTQGSNAHGPDPKGDGTDIARVFDAPDDEPRAASEPYKPVFDFGPGSQSTARGIPAVREAAPAPQPQRYAPSASSYSAPGAARPTFGKRR